MPYTVMKYCFRGETLLGKKTSFVVWGKTPEVAMRSKMLCDHHRKLHGITQECSVPKLTFYNECPVEAGTHYTKPMSRPNRDRIESDGAPSDTNTDPDITGPLDYYSDGED